MYVILMTSEMENETKATEGKQEIEIAELKPKMSDFIVTFKVVDIGETREVTSRRTFETHRVADAKVGDKTGIVNVPLWNESISEMKVGKTYRLEDGYTGLFRGNLQLKIGKHSIVTEAESEIETVNSDVDMSAENHLRSRDRGYYNPPRGYGRQSGYGSSHRRGTDRRSRHDNYRRRKW